MKFKTFSLAAMAALLFSACSKDEVGNPDFNNNDQDTKSVFLKFDSDAGAVARSVETPASSTKATLSNALIYFMGGNSDNSLVYAVKQVGGNGADLAMEDLVKGYEFTKIPKDVKYVYVVGNFENSRNQSAGFPKRTGVSLAEIKATNLNIEQVNSESSALETVLDGIAPVIVYNDANKDQWTGTIIPAEDDLFASVEVSPINARIEIKELSYTGELQSFTIEGIYINNYSQNAPLSLVQTTGA